MKIEINFLLCYRSADFSLFLTPIASPKRTAIASIPPAIIVLSATFPTFHFSFFLQLFRDVFFSFSFIFFDQTSPRVPTFSFFPKLGRCSGRGPNGILVRPFSLGRCPGRGPTTSQELGRWVVSWAKLLGRGPTTSQELGRWVVSWAKLLGRGPNGILLRPPSFWSSQDVGGLLEQEVGGRSAALGTKDWSLRNTSTNKFFSSLVFQQKSIEKMKNRFTFTRKHSKNSIRSNFGPTWESKEVNQPKCSEKIKQIQQLISFNSSEIELYLLISEIFINN